MIPSRALVLLYLTTAHISLALAFALTGWNPYAVAGFFYHSRMVAIIHLITIGWIAMSVLGMVYIVLPMTFGLAFPARKGDYAAYALAVIGLIKSLALELGNEGIRFNSILPTFTETERVIEL